MLSDWFTLIVVCCLAMVMLVAFALVVCLFALIVLVIVLHDAVGDWLVLRLVW